MNYTIPSDNRELQPGGVKDGDFIHYTIPSDNRELQRNTKYELKCDDYTIPSDNRELQLVKGIPALISIIPYQVITGNYNGDGWNELPI